jgi:antitoxin CcdA
MSATAAEKKVRRRPVNLTVREDLVTAAKELGINASQAAEQGLAAAVRTAREQAWLKENAEAIEYWNEWIRENGLPLKPLWLEDD